jgi:hypothetical protein
MKPLLLLLAFLPLLIFAQSPAPPPPAPAPPPPTAEFGTTQNNIMGAQSKSFGGGSMIRPNPILTSADFGFIQNPTFETGWRYGTGLGWGRINMGRGFGVNAVITFDFTQQTYSTFYTKNDWYYHFNFGKMGKSLNTGLSVTKIWEPLKVNKLLLGTQMGLSTIMSRDSSNEYFILVPYLVLIAQKEFDITKRISWRPETFITLGSPYYDIGLNLFTTSNTFNAVVGNNISFKLSKKFKFNVNWRMNMNTTPKWGLMNNVLIGTNLGF